MYRLTERRSQFGAPFITSLAVFFESLWVIRKAIKASGVFWFAGFVMRSPKTGSGQAESENMSLCIMKRRHEI